MSAVSSDYELEKRELKRYHRFVEQVMASVRTKTTPVYSRFHLALMFVMATCWIFLFSYLAQALTICGGGRRHLQNTFRQNLYLQSTENLFRTAGEEAQTHVTTQVSVKPPAKLEGKRERRIIPKVKINRCAENNRSQRSNFVGHSRTKNAPDERPFQKRSPLLSFFLANGRHIERHKSDTDEESLYLNGLNERQNTNTLRSKRTLRVVRDRDQHQEKLSERNTNEAEGNVNKENVKGRSLDVNNVSGKEKPGLNENGKNLFHQKENGTAHRRNGQRIKAERKEASEKKKMSTHEKKGKASEWEKEKSFPEESTEKIIKNEKKAERKKLVKRRKGKSNKYKRKQMKISKEKTNTNENTVSRKGSRKEKSKKSKKTLNLMERNKKRKKKKEYGRDESKQRKRKGEKISKTHKGKSSKIDRNENPDKRESNKEKENPDKAKKKGMDKRKSKKAKKEKVAKRKSNRAKKRKIYKKKSKGRKHQSAKDHEAPSTEISKRKKERGTLKEKRLHRSRIGGQRQ
ncbi:DNA ligase 1-like [Macrobrachium rosenbergii]|uniref:DNA ligase 1-like n=1 Tax=Macrobrachium rosenbergii TaxID=79674 RepID=UPI0034D7601B